ncbi:hypothetical protein, partial [Desulfurella sp.]|uniref:hypothetical protein n=1 Tax=Desulfurella sp. TaxID=1962857 RepID=UPI0025BED3DB
MVALNSFLKYISNEKVSLYIIPILYGIFITYGLYLFSLSWKPLNFIIYEIVAFLSIFILMYLLKIFFIK